MRKTIVLATRNPGKIREILAVLKSIPVSVGSLDAFARIDEPVEDGATFGDNARLKALYYARATGQWCLADDSGLQIDALNGEPGVFSARYACAEGPAGAGREFLDRANNAKVLRLLEEVPDAKRTARFVCHLALASPERVLLETFDTVEGRIARAPAGENGFGYDPLFLLPERGCTTAQLAPEEKNAISHRGKAVRRFAQLLTTFLARQSP